MTTLLGYEATLTLDLDGEPFDVSHLIKVDGTTGHSIYTTGQGIYINPESLIHAVEVERKVRARVKQMTGLPTTAAKVSVRATA